MGSGYRVFTAGEVLSASNVQNYLQDQAVMVFGGTAARSSAIGTANFEEGMLTYLTDVDKLQVYTGAAFADVYPAAASNQGLTLISTTSFSGVTSVSLPAATFSATYKNYKIVLNHTNVTADYMQFRMRASGTDLTSAVYGRSVIIMDSALGYVSSTAQTSGWAGNSNANLAGGSEINVYSPFETVVTRVYAYGTNKRTTNASSVFMLGSIVDNTTSYDSMSFFSSSGNIAGTLQVFGYNE